MILDIKVGTIMKKPLVTIDSESTVLAAAKLMNDRNMGGLVVTRGNEPVGIVTERDLLRKVLAGGRDPGATRVKEVMTPDPVSVDKDSPLSEAIDLMNRRKFRRMLVADAGRVVGIFTQRDVMALNRVCLHCGKEMKSALEVGQRDAEPYIECVCGSRYHVDCAKVVVNCVDCSRTLVTHVIYPEPSETTGG